MAKSSRKEAPPPTARQVQAATVSEASSMRPLAEEPKNHNSTATVLIGCKLPHGLTLEIIEPGTVVDKDGKPVQRFRPAVAGRKVILKGANSLRTDRRSAQGVHPYAVTRVEKAFWEAWLARNRDLEFVRKQLVFEAPTLEDARAMAKERIGERTGLEALKSEKDPRLPKARKPEETVDFDPDAMAKVQAGQGEVAVV